MRQKKYIYISKYLLLSNAAFRLHVDGMILKLVDNGTRGVVVLVRGQRLRFVGELARGLLFMKKEKKRHHLLLI